MAVTITRTAWIDDDGSGTVGTVINNAEKTLLYNQIDAALAQLVPLSGGVTVSGVMTFTSTVIVNGAVQIGASMTMRNMTANSRVDFWMGNDANAALLDVVTYGSAYSSGTFDLANGSLWYHAGVGGMTFLTAAGAATIRFFTSSTERLRMTGAGDIFIGNAVTSFPTGPVALGFLTDASTRTPIGIQNTYTGGQGALIIFCNYGNGTVGSISQTTLNNVAYNTSSDGRLKDDDGPATDLSALRAVVVRDFRWKADGIRDRGVFAQEAVAAFPRAITEGGDEVDEAGTLTRPWMTDYSKFVADLIVGWQQHDAELVMLRAELATLKGH